MENEAKQKRKRRGGNEKEYRANGRKKMELVGWIGCNLRTVTQIVYVLNYKKIKIDCKIL